MAKSKEAFRTISEVATELDVPQHVLRFWETKFNQIKPLKRGGGRRYYRPEDVDLLKGIQRLLHSEGYTIKGVQKIFREQGARAIQQGLISREQTDGRTKTTASGPGPIQSAAPQPGVTAEQRRILSALRNDLSEIRRLLRSTL